MQLANSNAQWNSKLGAAFGLKSISNVAKDQMKPHLEKIVPRLFRYRYDPTPKIQNSMISVWDSIVSDSKETIELYYWAIFDELGKIYTFKNNKSLNYYTIIGIKPYLTFSFKSHPCRVAYTDCMLFGPSRSSKTTEWFEIEVRRT